MAASDGAVPPAAVRGADGVFERSLGFLCFLMTMLSMATIGLIVPLSAAFTGMLALSTAEFGLALSLFSMPSALLSVVVGYLCDRIGGRRLFLGGAVLAVAADLLLVHARSATMFKFDLLLAGLGFAAIVVSSPELMVANLEGIRRTRAISLWATYAPVGVAAGLLLAAPFAGQPGWRMAIYLHCGLLLVAAVLAAAIFRQGKAAAVRSASRPGAMLAMIRHGALVRLGIALAIPSAISYGTSLLAPSYITAATHVSIASSAVLVAAAKIIVALSGGLFAGWLLARTVSPSRMFAWLAVVGCIGQLALFYPASGLVVSLAGLAAWLFAYTGISALAFVLLPTVFARPAEMGAANGLVSQLVSCASFTAPIVYFAGFSWPLLVGLSVVGMGIALLLLPRAPAGAVRPGSGADV